MSECIETVRGGAIEEARTMKIEDWRRRICLVFKTGLKLMRYYTASTRQQMAEGEEVWPKSVVIIVIIVGA